MTRCANWWHDPRGRRTNTAGRSASWSTCRDRSCGFGTFAEARSSSTTARASCWIPTRRPATATRVHLPHPEILAALEARPCAVCSTTARSGSSPRRLARARRRQRRCRRQDFEPQGRQPARHRNAGLGDDARRTAPISRPASMTGVDWVALSFVQRAEDVAEAKKIDPRPRRGDGQDRKAAGDRAARRNHRGLRRADGRARRSRRRNAAGKSAGPAEADDARLRAAPASRWSSRRRCWNR